MFFKFNKIILLLSSSFLSLYAQDNILQEVNKMQNQVDAVAQPVKKTKSLIGDMIDISKGYISISAGYMYENIGIGTQGAQTSNFSFTLNNQYYTFTYDNDIIRNDVTIPLFSMFQMKPSLGLQYVIDPFVIYKRGTYQNIDEKQLGIYSWFLGVEKRNYTNINGSDLEIVQYGLTLDEMFSHVFRKIMYNRELKNINIASGRQTNKTSDLHIYPFYDAMWGSAKHNYETGTVFSYAYGVGMTYKYSFESWGFALLSTKASWGNTKSEELGLDLDKNSFMMNLSYMY